MSETIVEVKDLCQFFPVRSSIGKKGYIHAVDHVSLKLMSGETFGLVGESGCGKSTLGRTILRLYRPTSGKIFYNGNDITNANMKTYRRKMQMIFQDPSASLNPRMTIGQIIEEPLKNYHLFSEPMKRKKRVFELLNQVGLNKDQIDRYPHEFSGGQQQRVGIARTLAVEPEFIVCDEPISALDVSIQSQIINMLEEMQEKRNLTYLFIAHDISVVRHISHHIGVMFLGQIVEMAKSNELVKNPLHPYTQILMSSVPIPDPDLAKNKKRIILDGELPSPIDPSPGCRFVTRCPYVEECNGRCKEETPELREITSGHFVACFKCQE